MRGTSNSLLLVCNFPALYQKIPCSRQQGICNESRGKAREVAGISPYGGRNTLKFPVNSLLAVKIIDETGSLQTASRTRQSEFLLKIERWTRPCPEGAEFCAVCVMAATGDEAETSLLKGYAGEI